MAQSSVQNVIVSSRFTVDTWTYVEKVTKLSTESCIVFFGFFSFFPQGMLTGGVEGLALDWDLSVFLCSYVLSRFCDQTCMRHKVVVRDILRKPFTRSR